MRVALFTFIFFSLLFAKGPIEPIPKRLIVDKQKAKIGKILFYDPNLSKDKKVSCATCHKKEYGGANNEEKGTGVFGRKTKYNVPSIYNLRFQYVYGWKNKKYDLKKKIEEVMKNPNIMEADFNEIVAYINSNNFLKKIFSKAYKNINKDAVIDALYNYLLTLNTTESKFDRYLLGYEELSSKEKSGFELFKRYGCIACHNGKSLGGHFYFKRGYFLDENNQEFIKCPSLRNVEESAPYFHDGKIKTLEEAIKWMARAQLGRDISDENAQKIAEFLKCLTGKVND